MVFIVFDDRDPAITYNQNHWGQNTNDLEFNSTNSFSDLPGSVATLKFSGGSSISVWGTINGPSPQTQYQIDNQTAVVLVAPTPNGNNNSTLFSQKFYEATNISPDNHTLTLTVMEGGATLYLDYFLMTPSGSVSVEGHSATPGLTQSSSDNTNSQAGTTTLFVSGPSAGPSSSGGASSSTSSDVNAIVGGILGGLSFILLLVVAFLWWRIKAKEREVMDKQGNTEKLWTRAINRIYSSTRRSTNTSRNHSDSEQVVTPYAEYPIQTTTPTKFQNNLSLVTTGTKRTVPTRELCM